MEYLLLFLLGIAVGWFGTLVGAGGGFVLMPILLLAFPRRDAAGLTAISLAVVFANAASGSSSYARMKRIDFRSGLLFLTTGIPGAAAGAYLVHHVPRQAFDIAFGGLMLAGAAFLFVRTSRETVRGGPARGSLRRSIVDAQGQRHTYAYSPVLGVAISFFVGLASSILGIGGGIIHVPAMVSVLNFPVHIATATSHFILAAMALVGTLVHVMDGSLRWEQAGFVLPIAAGAVVGAQAGAVTSRHVRGRWIMRILAAALGLVGVRILLTALLG